MIGFAGYDLKNRINAWTGNWLLLGEWSLASPSSANFDNDDDLRRYAEAQINAFNGATGGWTFWSWKFYNDDGSRNGWSMKAMVNRGIIRL